MLNYDYRAAILTSSDSGAAGEREDISGRMIRDMLAGEGYKVAATAILPDDRVGLSEKMLEWSESGGIDLILTTGGTGFSPRDQMPEATMSIADRNAPGIAEAIRAHSMGITTRAMFSRAASVICRNTLIINLPGSPKAIGETLEFLLPELGHALDVLTGKMKDCVHNIHKDGKNHK
jgi:molybdopterin adenylyltransferase